MRTDILRSGDPVPAGRHLSRTSIRSPSPRCCLCSTRCSSSAANISSGRISSARRAPPLRWGRSLALDLIRKAMRRRAGGWKGFRHIERFYYRGLNNAVMGAEPNSSLFDRYLRAMLTVKPERLKEAYALGPDLLQDVVADDGPADLVVHDPKVFYPLPPEISEHWFRPTEDVRLDAVLSAETRVVHWYASVRTKSRVALIDPVSIAQHRDNQALQRAGLEVRAQPAVLVTSIPRHRRSGAIEILRRRILQEFVGGVAHRPVGDRAGRELEGHRLAEFRPGGGG